jgi:O-succinylhomoserine (thiol)-lyase
MKFATKAVHSGSEPERTTQAVIPPIHLSTTFAQKVDEQPNYEYSRTNNPTRSRLETCLASLEGGKYAVCFASGLAAISAVMNLLKSEDHVVVSNDVYGGTYRLFENVLSDYKLEFTFTDTTDPNNITESLKENTKMIWIETPSNPQLKLTDIKKTAEISHKKGILLVVDNTFMSPYFQNPLSFNADIVVHSTTKYIGGHSDVVGGVVVTSSEKVHDKLRFIQNAVGAVPSPFDCWLVLRGIKTLALRMQKHNGNAQKMAEFLKSHPRISKVIYPGLEDHPQHNLAKEQMTGFGGIVSFELKGDMADARKLLGRLKVFTLAESLGGVESLIDHCASMTHAAIPREKRLECGLCDELIRISVGIEDADDLIKDLEDALKYS